VVGNANFSQTFSKNCLPANFFKKSLITNLLGKGLIENPGSGVINRRNGCGATVALMQTILEEFAFSFFQEAKILFFYINLFLQTFKNKTNIIFYIFDSINRINSENGVFNENWCNRYSGSGF
jgi:hypothetical protein